MRFPVTTHPRTNELQKLWDEGLIVLDTNALLNLFQYSGQTRGDFFNVLEAKANSLWIPHQAGLEFHRRRIDVENAQTNAFQKLSSAVASAKNPVEKALNEYTRDPSLDASQLRSTLETSLGAIQQSIDAARENHNRSITERNMNANILARITALYEGKVGAAWTQVELDSLYKDGETRYSSKVPPGYEDAKDKQAPAMYGDLVLWKQLLRHSAGVNRPAIFVTADQKEDWWYRVSGKTQGARPELVDEYFVASGERVHFMLPERLLDFAKERLVDVSDASVDEAQHLSALERELTRRMEAEKEIARMRHPSRFLVDDLFGANEDLVRAQKAVAEAQSAHVALKELATETPTAENFEAYLDAQDQLARARDWYARVRARALELRNEGLNRGRNTPRSARSVERLDGFLPAAIRHLEEVSDGSGFPDGIDHIIFHGPDDELGSMRDSDE